MKLLILLLFSSCVFGAGNPDIPDIELTWDTPTSREDGTALPLEEISNYTIYVRGRTVNVPSTENSYTFVDVDAGLYTFEISTTDSDMTEGARSDPVSETIPKAGIAVLTLTIKVTCSKTCVYEIVQ